MKKLLLSLTIIFSCLFSYAQFMAPQVGSKAINIRMQNPDGQTISLSDLKGKVVLIDFWASWCRPCRMENPYVVKAYNDFKDKEFTCGQGFEIFSVSLDQKKIDWQNAIAKDGLVWENHVSDLKGWQNRAAIDYQIQSIPSNYLIDKDMNIIATNLRGEALYQKLAELAK